MHTVRPALGTPRRPGTVSDATGGAPGARVATPELPHQRFVTGETRRAGKGTRHAGTGEGHGGRGTADGTGRSGAADAAVRSPFELIPAIDVCLRRVTSRPARVTFAASVDEGQVAVRIRESDSSRYECVADSAGAAVSVYESLSDIDHRTNEGNPEFQRGGSHPRESCATEATDRDGASLGWLIPERC